MNILIMILLISFLVMVHELGHFLVAKAFKIRVDKFGFGLPVGPTLFRKQIGETEFLVHALLLGGYVAFPDDDADSEIAKDSPERFANKPAYQRFFVVVAGVFANFVTAVLLVMLTAGIWHKLPTSTFETSFEELLPTATQSVKAAGFQKGDVFYEINGSKVNLPSVLTQYLYLSKSFDGYASQEQVDKKLTELKKLNPNINPDKVISKGTVIVLPDAEDEKPVSLTSDEVIGFERYKSNEIELTDMQKAVRDNVQGKKYYKIKIPTTFEDLAFSLADTRKPVTITVLRNGEKITLPPIYPDKDGFMGIKKDVVEVMYPVNSIKENIVHKTKFRINALRYRQNVCRQNTYGRNARYCCRYKNRL